MLTPLKFAGDWRFELLAVVAAFGLAVLTYHFVEQPFQTMRRGTRPWRVLALGLPVAVLVSAGSFAGAAIAMPNSGLRVEALPAQYQTLGDGPGTVPAAIPTNVKPSILDVGYDLQDSYHQCYGPGLPECWAGDPHGARTVLVIGDSYAGMLWPSLEQAATEHGWRVALVSRAGCSLIAPGEL